MTACWNYSDIWRSRPTMTSILTTTRRANKVSSSASGIFSSPSIGSIGRRSQPIDEERPTVFSSGAGPEYVIARRRETNRRNVPIRLTTETRIPEELVRRGRLQRLYVHRVYSPKPRLLRDSRFRCQPDRYISLALSVRWPARRAMAAALFRSISVDGRRIAVAIIANEQLSGSNPTSDMSQSKLFVQLPHKL